MQAGTAKAGDAAPAFLSPSLCEVGPSHTAMRATRPGKAIQPNGARRLRGSGDSVSSLT
jgi:hypothetical protein